MKHSSCISSKSHTHMSVHLEKRRRRLTVHNHPLFSLCLFGRNPPSATTQRTTKLSDVRPPSRVTSLRGASTHPDDQDSRRLSPSDYEKGRKGEEKRRLCVRKRKRPGGSCTAVRQQPLQLWRPATVAEGGLTHKTKSGRMCV